MNFDLRTCDAAYYFVLDFMNNGIAGSVDGFV